MSPEPRPARTRRRGAELENALYAATLAELAEVGYSALSMDRIAARAHTGKAALYRRWSNKQQLTLAALENAMPELPTPEDSHPVRENLRTVFTAFCEALGGDTPLPSLTIAVDLLREPELRSSFAATLVAPRLKMIASILRSGARAGELDPTTLAPLAAQIGPALILQSVLLTGVPPTRDEIEQIIDTVLASARPRTRAD